MHERVFVYGTLRRGQPNHDYLTGASLLGPARTPPGYTLYDLGPYPAVVAGGTGQVHGEVYVVDLEILAALDRLEGYPGYYDRRRIDTGHGQAWLYVMPSAHPAWPVVPAGDWVAYLRGPVVQGKAQ